MKYARTKNVDALTCDGITFDSLGEVRRYQELKTLQQCGAIKELHWQTKFDIRVNDVHICYYKCDFNYLRSDTNETVVEDCKGFTVSKKTGKLLPRVNREFGIKRKLMFAVFGIRVEVV